MSKRSFAFAAVLFALVFSFAVSDAYAQKSGRYRITLRSRSVVEGDVKEVDGGYEVTTRQGAVITVKKNDVVKMDPVDGGKPAAAKPAGTKAGDAKSAPSGSENNAAEPENDITDEEIAAVIGSDEIESSEVSSPDIQDLRALPTNKDSVQQMVRIASTSGRAASTLETDHFVLIYTSTKETARELGSRLESIYKWVHIFLKMMAIPPVRPEYKLEIYFFNTHDEYQAYGNNIGGIPSWAAGFYLQTNNRSAFYDLIDEPGTAALRERLKGLPASQWREKQFVGNRVKRRSDFFNLTVIQHEAAHHIHFNTGIFNKRGDYPRWLVEGLAQMFELPPGKLGGSLGATNHFRLYQFNQQYRRNKDAVIKTRLFVADDRTWGPEQYPHGWALVNFLYKKHRDQFAAYMRKMALREDDVEFTATQKQEEFEDIFKVTDADKFHQEFLDYIFSIQYRWTALE